MLVEIKIKDISLFEKSSYKIKKVYNNEKVLINDNFTQKIKTFHDSVFSNLKIVLEKESILSSTVGFVEIRLRDLRNQERSFCIYDGKYEQDFHSYPFVSKRVVGNMIIQFKITEEEFEETHRNNQPSFLDRIFHDIFNVEKDTKFSLILARMISFSTGNASSYFNSTKGFYFLLNFYSAEEKKFSFSKIVDFLNSLRKNESISSSFLNDGIDSKIEEVKNNFELCDNAFYLKYKKILSYAISSYGNSIITNSLKSRKIKERLEMKDYLEYLGDNVSEIKFYNVIGSNYLPIFIAFEDNESFVISFRGTFSVRDTICDLKFEYKEFYEGFSHEGFTELAEEFLKKYTQNILENIKSKKLIITGHSLGGSIAHLVGYLLLKRNLVKKEDLEVITFSSAPILSKNIVEKDLFENFSTFTLSNDSVPFLYFGSICDLRYLTTSLGVKLNLFTTTYSEIRDLIYTIKEYLIQTDLYPKLYIPGKIYQFKEYKDNSKSRFHKLFKLLQRTKKEIKVFLCKETDYTFCNEIILDLNSAMYHMPGSLMDVFDESIRLNKFIEVRENQNVL